MSKFLEILKRNKKKSIIFALVFVVVLWSILSPKGQNLGDIQTDTVKKQDLKQTVLATGQVTSKTDLSLSFKVSGITSSVNVKVGDRVKSGQVLANLSQGDIAGRLTQARASLALAQANLQKIIDGSSDEEVRVAQVALDNAKISLQNTKTQQATLVANAYNSLLNSTLSADPGASNTTHITVTISGSYNGTEQGSYKINIFPSGGGWKFQYTGLENGTGYLNTNPQVLGTRGLFITFSAITGVDVNDSWEVNIPNTQASTYVTNFNTYQSALQTQSSAVTAAESAVETAQANLDLKKAKARPADLQAAEAQVLNAQGQVQLAAADLENTMVRAPADGTITLVDIKPGELASALKQVFVLQDVSNLHIEANISEANIASIKPDQPVEVTFDALGSDRKFEAKVQAIDPASTLVSGVVNYKVTITQDKLDEVKPGMTANVSILTGSKDAALAVPLRAVLSHDNKKFVRVITDSKKKTYQEKEVTLGMEADGGLVEITNGLSEGQEIVTFIKTK